MIHYFTVSNFLSIREEQTLSFEATREKSSEEHYVHPISGLRLLKVLYLYGSNGSGKSNLIYALNALFRLMLFPAKEKATRLPITPFLLDDQSAHTPTAFELSFFVNEVRYCYVLQLLHDRILHEELRCFTTSRSSTLYRRAFNEEKQKSEIEFKPLARVSRADKQTIDGQTLANRTVLSAIALCNIERSPLTEVFDALRDIFLEVVSPTADFRTYAEEKLSNSPQAKEFVLDLMQQSDFNLTDLDVVETDIPINDQMKRLIQTGLIEEGEELLKSGVVTQREIIFRHGKWNLSYNQQSNGTQRFLGLACLLYDLIERPRLITIDELGTNLHYELLAHFVKLFLLYNRSSQMLIATHDINLLDEDFIRRDAIRFAEKSSKGATEIFSFCDVDLRNSISPYQAYKTGKIGATPFLSTLLTNLPTPSAEYEKE